MSPAELYLWGTFSTFVSLFFLFAGLAPDTTFRNWYACLIACAIMGLIWPITLAALLYAIWEELECWF